MQLITLTTDFGARDFYAGALKGALIKRHRALQLVDISHEIKPFDIVQGAFVLQNTWPEFPEGTIHLVGVHCVYGPEARFIAARYAGHYFLAPDNGLLSLLFEHLPENDLRSLGRGAAGHFPVKDVFADAATHLAQGHSFETLGTPAGQILHRISIQPVITKSRIRGTVVHLDNFDNVVVNISRALFEKTQNGRNFSLFFKRNDPISNLSQNYADVPVGEPLCLFNSAGYLEIAINMGRAASLLGLKVEDIVELVFE
ncbi:MAG: SAM-dependent chlorinase/fluorinase [Bacteroidota bacterium]